MQFDQNKANLSKVDSCKCGKNTILNISLLVLLEYQIKQLEENSD